MLIIHYLLLHNECVIKVNICHAALSDLYYTTKLTFKNYSLKSKFCPESELSWQTFAFSNCFLFPPERPEDCRNSFNNQFLKISPDSQTFLILFTMLDKKSFLFYFWNTASNNISRKLISLFVLPSVVANLTSSFCNFLDSYSKWAFNFLGTIKKS